MTQPTLTAITRLWGASIALIVVSVITGLSFHVHIDKRSVINRTSEQMLYDATIAAISLDAILQKAALEIEAAVRRGVPEEKAITFAAFGIQEAENIYLFDEDGAVIVTAYSRLDPHISGLTDAFERLDAGAETDCRIVDVPSEGGKALALLFGLPAAERGRRYAAVLFTELSMLGKLTALGSGSYESMKIRDQRGNAMTIIEGRTPSARKSGEALLAEVPLTVLPLVVATDCDSDIILGDWRTRLAILSVVVTVFGAVLGGMFAFGLRILRRAELAKSLQKELDHQEVLFKEVNHRIKNNLTIVMTVLGLGADRIAEHPDAAARTLESAIDRVRAIALLHELLYKKALSSRDDFGAYIEALANALSETYGQDGRIAIEATHDEDIRFNMDRAVPLALMVNEIVTNAYKHAFPGDKRGTIQVRASRDAEGGVSIRVEDDGVGMVDGRVDSTGVGTMLLEALGKQLEATIRRRANQPSGTSWTIQIPSSGPIAPHAVP